MDASKMLLARGQVDAHLLLKYGNRHGLIAGATGTGKSVSLQVLAEGFSKRGVPVFMADVKGDLAGLSQASTPNEKLDKRLQMLGVSEYQPAASPVQFWDLYAQKGHPVRTTVSEIGPLLLARMLDLNDTQEGVLNVVFRVADEEGLMLLDLEDLRAMLSFVSENSKAISEDYGLVAPASIAAIQRSLLALENEGAGHFLGEPALDLRDFFRVDPSGRGVVNILAADQLLLRPRLYSTFLLWLLSELFEQLPEVGDLDKPRMVFFFDEAHLLFNDVSSSLLQRIEQVVRLIRSKGVGVYFISQLPDDVPDVILGQLGNRVQHALRAFTPRDQKAVRTAAETFVQHPDFKVEQVITQLGVGEALVSCLGEGGIPQAVQRVWMMPPSSRIGAISDDERAQTVAQSSIAGKYEQAVNRESAYEVLKQRREAPAAPPEPETKQSDGGWSLSWPWGNKPAAPPPAPAPAPAPRSRRYEEDDDAGHRTQRPPRSEPRQSRGYGARQSVGEVFAKTVVRTVGSQLGRRVLRGILGAILK
jgi:hypothetical protein